MQPHTSSGALPTVYTIGYAGFSPEKFLAALRDRQVSVLVDVRSTPFSQHFPDYNQDRLAAVLKQNGLYYRNYAKEFGARQEDLGLYHPDGYLDFERFAQSDAFQSGVQKLCRSMEQGYTFALMCAEKRPITCHRAILVARAFSGLGYPVLHLLPGGETQSPQEMEQELLELYFPDRDQGSLFDGFLEESVLLNRAYRLQNAKIGFRKENLL